MNTAANALKSINATTQGDWPVRGRVAPKTCGVGFGVGAEVTVVLGTKVLQSKQEIPPPPDPPEELLPLAPDPPPSPPELPPKSGSKLKCALTVLSPLMTSVQTGLSPVKSPLQVPVKVEPESGVADKVTVLPAGT